VIPADEATAGTPTWCHIVRRGESLAQVARRAATSETRLRELNALDRGGSIHPGDVLLLPVVERLLSGWLVSFATAIPASRGHRARENIRIHADRLSRLRTRAALDRFVLARLLVPVPDSARGLRLVGVPEWRRVTRPWTRLFPTSWATPCTACSAAVCASPT
jgi:hypothetical protein